MMLQLPGVPVERQKVMCKGAWLGALKDGQVFDENLAPRGKKTELMLTLMGTCEAVVSAPQQPTVFAEDELSPEAAAALDADAIAAAEGKSLRTSTRVPCCHCTYACPLLSLHIHVFLAVTAHTRGTEWCRPATPHAHVHNTSPASAVHQ